MVKAGKPLGASIPNRKAPRLSAPARAPFFLVFTAVFPRVHALSLSRSHMASSRKTSSGRTTSNSSGSLFMEVGNGKFFGLLEVSSLTIFVANSKRALEPNNSNNSENAVPEVNGVGVLKDSPATPAPKKEKKSKKQPEESLHDDGDDDAGVSA